MEEKWLLTGRVYPVMPVSLTGPFCLLCQDSQVGTPHINPVMCVVCLSHCILYLCAVPCGEGEEEGEAGSIKVNCFIGRWMGGWVVIVLLNLSLSLSLSL